MKIAKFFACILGLLGTALMVCSIGLCLMSLDAPAKVIEMPQGATNCSVTLMEAVSDGDYEAVQNLIWGQPDLGAQNAPADQAGKMIWDTFLNSISYEFKGECYVSGTGMARDAVITAIDIPTVTQTVQKKSRELMNRRVAEAEDVMALYDSTGNFRRELVEEVLHEAITLALAEESVLVSRDVTVTLICREGQWWALPDTALLTAISGGVA